MTDASQHLADVLDRQDAEDHARALRALLRHPLLTPSGPDPAAFRLVRAHADWLRQWLADRPGWSLQVETEFARLRKLPGDLTDGTRAALAEVGGALVPFTRRRYVLLCLALAALERADAQITLGRLAERVLSLAGDPALQEQGFTFTLESRDERKDLVVVTRLLLRIHVLTKVAGDEQAYVAASGDVLYDVERRVLASLLVATRGPSMVRSADFEERLAAVTEELAPDSEEGRNRTVRQRLARRLLDDPVVYVEDLSEEERAYLATQRHFVLGRLAEPTGLVAEARSEGMALLDPTGDTTDLRMPEEGTEGHATLLLAEYLTTLPPETNVPMGELEGVMARLTAEHRSRWKKAASEPGAEVALCRGALDRLEALGLVRREAHGVTPRPALARYAYGRPIVPGAAEEAC